MSPRRYQRSPRGTPGPHKPHPDAVIVDRTSRWGNPFRVADHGRPLAVEYHRRWLFGLGDHPEPDPFQHLRDPADLLAELEAGTLTGRDLVCVCSLDEACHADTLLGFSVVIRPPGQPPAGKRLAQASRRVSGSSTRSAIWGDGAEPCLACRSRQEQGGSEQVSSRACPKEVDHT